MKNQFKTCVNAIIQRDLKHLISLLQSYGMNHQQPLLIIIYGVFTPYSKLATILVFFCLLAK